MSSDEKIPTKPQGAPIRLDGEYQAVSVGLIGFGLIGAGVIAVFRTDVEAGPVAIMLIGLFLVVIGLARQLPNRFKVGDYEMELAALQQFAVEVVDDAPAASRPELLELLTELSRAAPAAANPALQAFVWDSMVVEMVRDLARQNQQFEVWAEPGPTTRWDLLVQGPNGRRIAIDVRPSTMRGAALFLKTAEAFQQARTRGEADYLLVITRKQPLGSVNQYFNQHEHMSLLVLDGTDDAPLLRAVLNQLTGAQTIG